MSRSQAGHGQPNPHDDCLAVDGLVVRFGGLVAVDGVSLAVGGGQIVGLIGPNGAGKTTSFNACSGLVRPSSGTVKLVGQDVTDKSAAERARIGLGRTFQMMKLYDRMSVRQNVAMGLEARLAGSRPLGCLFATRRERAAIAEATRAALDRCRIAHLAEQTAGTLSSGQRRLVELARALAGDFRVLLLDEPSSGLDSRETQMFADILQSAVHAGGPGILLVEHDMSLVRTVCEYTYVLEFGRLIAHGPTDEILASSAVRSAYLGEAGAADVPA